MTRDLAVVLFAGALVGCAHTQTPAPTPAPAASTPTASTAAARPRGDEDVPSAVTAGRDPFSDDHPPAAPDVSDTGPGITTPVPPEEVAPQEALVAPEESLDDEKILGVTHAANEGEIEQAKLAKSRASDARVRRFAAHIVRDHAMADLKGEKIARSDKLNRQDSEVSDELRSSAQGTLTRLRSLHGADFDRAYVEAQVDQHDEVLKLIDDKLLPNAERDDVKTLVRSIRPAIQRHFDQARTLKDQLEK